MKAALAVVLVLTITAQCSARVPYKWYTVQSGDPVYRSIFSQAMARIGLTTNGLVIKEYQMQWTVPLRYNYKATYTNMQGERCFLQWSVDSLLGAQVFGMPNCVREANSPMIILQTAWCPTGSQCPSPACTACPVSG